jgi:hypothetical protein
MLWGVYGLIVIAKSSIIPDSALSEIFSVILKSPSIIKKKPKKPQTTTCINLEEI